MSPRPDAHRRLYCTDQCSPLGYPLPAVFWVVNPRTERVESAAEIQEAIEAALTIIPAERLFLNPDCGFGTFSRRPVNSLAGAAAKLSAIVQAARSVRERLGAGTTRRR